MMNCEADTPATKRDIESLTAAAEKNTNVLLEVLELMKSQGFLFITIVSMGVTCYFTVWVLNHVRVSR
jgi:hypothetical protein